LIVTTARKKEHLEDEAIEIARTLNVPYRRRESYSIPALCRIEGVEHVVVLTSERLYCVFKDDVEHPFFFHPNSAMFRLRRLRKGGTDPLLDITGLEAGMSFLDCTLGLAADAAVASYRVGKQGRVVGIESVPVVGLIVEHGLRTWTTEHDEFNQAMRRIEVRPENHLDYLRRCTDEQFDMVYFDPMFEQTVRTSSGIAPLKKLARYTELTDQVVAEARRVARHKVVLKDSPASSRFSAFGFEVQTRPYAPYCFGIIEK
jgi:hypothetical protein